MDRYGWRLQHDRAVARGSAVDVSFTLGQLVLRRQLLAGTEPPVADRSSQIVDDVVIREST
jgi:hypothetical protein